MNTMSLARNSTRSSTRKSIVKSARTASTRLTTSDTTTTSSASVFMKGVISVSNRKTSTVVMSVYFTETPKMIKKSQVYNIRRLFKITLVSGVAISILCGILFIVILCICESRMLRNAKISANANVQIFESTV